MDFDMFFGILSSDPNWGFCMGYITFHECRFLKLLKHILYYFHLYLHNSFIACKVLYSHDAE